MNLSHQRRARDYLVNLTVNAGHVELMAAADIVDELLGDPESVLTALGVNYVTKKAVIAELSEEETGEEPTA